MHRRADHTHTSMQADPSADRQRRRRSVTRAEQETIARYDEEERLLHIYTANQAVARRLGKLGYTFEVAHLDRHGEPTGWEAEAPVEALRFRKLEGGTVAKRKGHRKGKLFGAQDRDGAEKHDEVIEVQHRAKVG